jgi:nucleosome assembly protein 1-like 1
MGKGKKGNSKVEELAEGMDKVTLVPSSSSAEDGSEGEDEEGSEEGSEGMELSGAVLKRIVALKALADEEAKIVEDYKKQRCELEHKFNALRTPLYTKRAGIVDGSVKVSMPPKEGEEPKEEPAATSDEEPDNGIPGFWLQVLANHHLTGEYITEEDVDALECLTDITVSYSPGMTSFVLSFHFDDNDFFTNKILTKEYTVDPDLLDDQSPTLSSVAAPNPIEWKEGKNLLVQEIQKKQRSKSGKKKGQIRYVTTTAPKPSFFHFFSEPKEDEEEEEEEPEDEDTPPTTFNVEDDYEVAHAIRTSLIPDAIGWYTGELIEEDDEDYGEDDEEDDEEDFDEEDNLSPDEDEEDEKPKKGKKGKGKLAGSAIPSGGEAQPECKQS